MLDAYSAPVVLGETIYIPFITSAGNFSPAAPDSAPTALLYPASAYAGQTGAKTMLVTAVTGETGRYVASYDATSANGFTAGQLWVVKVKWVISGTNYGVDLLVPIG
jgi:hypothetical protein